MNHIAIGPDHRSARVTVTDMNAQCAGTQSARAVEGTAPEWAVHLQPCGALLVDRRSLFYFRLSGRGIELALEVARTGSVDGAARIESCLTGTPVPQIEDELRSTLEAHPVTAAWKDGLLGTSLRVTGTSDAYIPLQCSLQLTNRCNLRCTHCYASSGLPYDHELSTAEWLRVLEQLATYGVAAVTLTGGEPTITKGFGRLLTAAATLFTTVEVFTNGMSWSDADVELASVLGNVGCQISIDGGRDHHDALRGRIGSYDRALEAIRRLSISGVPITVSMTATPQNWRDVGHLIEEVSDAGATLFRAGLTVPVGRAQHGHLGLTPEQTDGVARQLDEYGQRCASMDVIGWEGEGGMDDLHLHAPQDFCTPGYLSWHIRADGGVTPCQIEEASFGNILSDSILALGSAQRLQECARCAETCECVQRVALPEEIDRPFTV